MHSFVNDLERSVGTYLYGRRMYEVMAVWETLATDDEPPVVGEYAEIWRAADKIVYSRSLEEVSTPRTRLVSEFDPDEVRKLKAAAERDLGVGGAALASSAIRAGLVDELGLFVVPHVVGGGKQALPDGVRLELELLDERRFESGVVFLRYEVRADGDAARR